MKKLCLILFLVLFAVLFSSCIGIPNDKICEHSYVEIERTEPRPMVDGEVKYACDLCDETKVEVIPMTRSLKVLAIGNSFSVDAVTYLYDICKTSGLTEIIIGNANIGGCSLDTHANNILTNNAAYAYKKYSTTKGAYLSGVTLDHALEDEEWDFVTLQQVSQLSGMPESLSALESIISHVNAKCPDAEIYWHMTWAYQQDSTHNGFKNYNNDQMTMYNSIVDLVKNNISTNPAFKGVIPSGTAMQNLRTSHLGDSVTRDGYHASYGIGRFTIAMTWYSVFTGGSLESVFWFPSNDYRTEIIFNRELIVESAKNAIENPYEVTQSQFTQAPSN